MCMERPLVYAAVRDLGLPIVDMSFHTNRDNIEKLPLPYPQVIKVGSAHAGMGKIRIRNREDFDDVNSVYR
eukprot:UN14996